MKYHPLTFALRLPVLFGLLLAYSLQPTAYSLTPTVRINEVMASNGTTIADEDGDFEDWIELYNYGTDPVDLSGWGLSDSYNNPFKWTFPGGTSIGAGEYLLVWASGKNRVIAYDRSWFQPFIDEAQGAWLFQGDQTPPHVLDRSVSENHGTINGEVTFVAENGFEQVLHFLPTGFVTLDHPFETAGDFTVSYWVKSLRATDWRAVNLSNGFGIGHWRSNRIVLMNPYVVVDLSTHLEVGSWEHVVFRRSENRVAVFLNGKAVGEGDWNGVLRLDRIGGKSGASGWAGMEGSLADVLFFDYALSAEALSDIFEGRRAAFGHWHTNYALSASGEEVLLTMPDGTLVDELAPTALPRDISIGRVEGEGDAWFFFDEPTPGGTNVTTAYLGILDPPTFSHVGGFYEEGFDLVLSHPEPEVAIVYSLDGSEPAIDNLLGTTFLYKNEYPEKPTDPFGPFLTSSYISHLYTEPLTIQDRSGEPDLLTQISSTTDAFPHYAPETPVRKGFSVQARAYKEGWLSSRSAANSYFVFEEGNPYTLPVISKQIQKDDLFDYYTGIYTAGLRMDEWRLANPEADVAWWFKNGNFRGRGDEWERTAFVEVFEDGVPHALLNQRVGVRIHGNTSRNLRAKSLRLYARGEYDNASVMDYRFLGDQYLHGLVSASESFKRILLRRRGAQRDYIQDPFAHRLMQPVYEGILRSRPAISFINGEYWGITNIRDRFDRHHLALNYGLDTDDLVVTFRDRIEDGGVIGAALFSELVEFILENEMKEDSIFEVVRQSLCLDSFSNFIIMNSYLQSPHFEHGFWRVKTPVDKSFGDGRWRIYTQDFDQIMRSSAGFNWMVDRKLRPSEEIYEALFQNAGFRRQFVNRFLDHINSTFTPHRIEEIVRGVYDEISPYVHEDEHRWSQNIAPFSSVNQIINFGRSRPASQREELRGRFSLGMDVEITLAASMESGKIRLNTLVIDSDLLGVQGYPYPWTGTYFQGVPIELEALPEPGHRFVGWVVSPTNGLASLSEGEPDFYSTEPLISLDLSGDTTVEAVFEPIPLADLPVAIHVWDFEDAGAFQNDGTLIAPSVTIGDGALVITPGPNPLWEAIPNTGGDFLTQHLRVNFPLGTTLTFALPTTGFESITLDFLTRRSGQGAEEMFVEYTLDGETWTSALEDPDYLTIFNAAPQVQGFDFSDVAGVSDNPDFAVRFTFAQGENGGTAGNNRFDDVILSGVALPGVNLPPVVTEAAPAFLELSAGRPLVVDLGDWFADPDGDALAFAAFAADGGLLGTEVSGSELTLTGLAAGETSFTVSANDGSNPAVTHSVRVLLYGAPHELSAGDFSFTAWSPDEPAGSFPPNMLFVQSNVNDPGLAAPLLFAYSIAGDAHADDDANFPYRATSRTRLNGLGDDGISFINTGRGRDLGGAVVSLDTTGKANVRVSFTGGTVMANARVYGLRLQYRVGLESAWTDVFDGESVVEYLRATDGDAEAFEAIALPAEVSDAPLVQLRWKYFHISGTSGARSMLRLDDIVVTAGEPGAATALAFAPGLQQWVQSGVAPGLLEVRAVDEDGALDPDFAGAVTLSLLGDGVLSGTLTAAAVDGVATFDDWVVTGPDGVFELLATAPGLTPAVSDAILLSTFPVFLPGGDGDWTLGANWTSVLFPNGTGLGAFVPAPALADRNVNLRAPVSIGSLIMDTGETAFRNRLRDRSTGNTLTFNGGGVPALLRITGTGEGFVELQNEAGTVLATDLRLAVENAVGDAEYGALRLRDGWSGPGGLIKEGPGMASLTGGDKNFAGAVWIEQGVLALTEPSVPANASGVTVLDGGQLRLVSASSESNPVRIYTFGGNLSLSGFGRSGVEEGEGMGILGALRYEPGSFGNFAEVSSAVVVAADAGIHVSGENTLALTGSLGGSGDLVKSGGGSLVLGNAPSTFTGAIEVERGELRLGGTNLSGNASTLSVVAEAALGGTGQWGGAVVLAGGSALSFDFAAGLPASAPLILGEWSAGGAIAVEVALPAGVTGPQRVTLIDAGAFATAPGAEVGNWVLSGAEAFPLSRLERAGEGLVLLLAATPFDLWTLENFGGSALADPAISGPLGEPLGDSVPNLLKYALGVGALERVDTEALSSGLDVGGHLFLRFRRDPAKADIVYVVEASADLLDWTETLYDSGIDLIPNNDGAHMVVSDSTAPSPGSPRFLRLRVKRDE